MATARRELRSRIYLHGFLGFLLHFSATSCGGCGRKR